MKNQTTLKKERWLNRVQNTKRYYFFQKWRDRSVEEKISVKKLFGWIWNDLTYVVKWNINLILQLRKHGPLVKEKSGLSYFEQWKRMGYLVFVLRTDSSELRYMQLFDDERWANADHFSYARHNIIEKNIEGFIPEDDVKYISNKFNFYKRCKENGWNTPEIYTIYEKGVQTYTLRNTFSLPEKDLFIKNLDSSGGKSAKYLIYKDDIYRDFDGEEFSESNLKKYLENQSKVNGGLLIQEAKRNHKEWRKFANGALSTCRIVTGKSLKKRGEIIPFFASLKMTVGKNDVDNYAKGGILSAIDMETGILHKAVGSKPYKGEISWDYHPNTGERITGTKLYMWNELVEFAKKLHKKFNTLSIGWDLTLAEEGPCVIEANSKWAANLIESPGNKPINMTLYPIWAEECIELLESNNSIKTNIRIDGTH